MSDDRLDRWRDLMVAALYDELDAKLWSELEAEMAGNPELEREWRELHEVRAALAVGGGAETGGRDLELVLPARRDERPGWRRAAMAAGVGFAAAASLFVGLLLAGLRVDATDAGLLVRFEPSGEAVGGGVSRSEAGSDLAPPGARAVTREEFAQLAELLVRSTSARLDDLERRQSANQMELVGALYDALAVDQRRQYDDLRARLDAAIVQVARVETGSGRMNRR